SQSYRIQSINPAIERILGYKPEEMLGRSIIDLAIKQERINFRSKIDEIITDSTASMVFECQFETFSKRITWVECRASYRNKAIFMNISDISPQKSFQE